MGSTLHNLLLLFFHTVALNHHKAHARVFSDRQSKSIQMHLIIKNFLILKLQKYFVTQVLPLIDEYLFAPA